MEETHHSCEELSLDQHATKRWRESRKPGIVGEGPVIRTSEAIMSDTDQAGEEGDYISILLPVDSKERRVLLRRSGTMEIDTREKEECRELRVSRQTCGCTCQLYCLPDTCPCAKVGYFYTNCDYFAALPRSVLREANVMVSLKHL